MADEFRITESMMADADTYLSPAMKEAIADNVARECIRPVYTIHPFGEKEDRKGEYGVSPVFCESAMNKSRVLMSVLMIHYLHAWSDGRGYLCDFDDYDFCAQSHVLNQLERFKAGKFREKAFDLLSDYKETEKYLNGAIYAVLREMNDPVRRFVEALGTMASAEWMESMKESIRDSAEGIEREKERQERIIRGEEPEENGEGEEVAG